MNHGLTVLAIDFATERAREAAAAQRAHEALAHRPPRSGVVRSALALALALVARGAAAGVRRLDACTADDLSSRLGSPAR